jgi:hypothetical protein
MRRHFIAAATVTLLACGSSGSSGAPSGAGPGGDGTTPGSTALAFVYSPRTCTVQGLPVSQSGLVLALADRSIAGACSLLSDTCVQFRNLHGTVVFLNGFDAQGTAAAVGPGTYPVNVTPTSLAGTFVFATAQSTDAACIPTRSDARAGNVTLANVSSQRVTGSYDLTLQDGSRSSGSFTATLCANTFAGGDDICALSATSLACTSGAPSCR